MLDYAVKLSHFGRAHDAWRQTQALRSQSQNVGSTDRIYHRCCPRLLTGRAQDPGRADVIESYVTLRRVCWLVVLVGNLVPNDSTAAKDVRVVGLIVVDKRASAGDSRGCGIAPAENDAVLVVEEIGAVAWIELRGLEAVVVCKVSAGPFPYASVVARQ